MLKLCYLALLCFIYCTLCQVAAVVNVKNATELTNDPPVNGTSTVDTDANSHVNATLYMGHIDTYTCTKHRKLTQNDKSDAVRAMDQHYRRGQWGQKCYDGWCVDARSLADWNSPQDCMRELRSKLFDCLQQGAGDGYIEQGVGFARCMMHYWCDGC